MTGRLKSGSALVLRVAIDFYAPYCAVSKKTGAMLIIANGNLAEVCDSEKNW